MLCTACVTEDRSNALEAGERSNHSRRRRRGGGGGGRLAVVVERGRRGRWPDAGGVLEAQGVEALKSG